MFVEELSKQINEKHTKFLENRSYLITTSIPLYEKLLGVP